METPEDKKLDTLNKMTIAPDNSRYPEKIPESQGDLADRANAEIDQEIQEGILRARQKAETATRTGENP